MFDRGDPHAVFRSLRENGPALLVPAAWLVAAATVLGAVSTHALFVAHVVMSALLVAFVVASWREMGSGVLRAWKLVIVAGTPVTLAGVAGFLALGGTLGLRPDALLAVSLYGWVLLPAAGFAYTGRRVEAGVRIYDLGAACCVAGAVGVALAPSSTWTAVALAVVGAGQTVGILDATLRY
ncbi:hypothetical protein FK85_09085 [Halorubrum saccharovorum]|uniref:Uncharacterized protein n=1 Tax=Halorubrum saccharovorum TaxID=2248 RepID=A0A081ETY1_9EURY|nr:MULTISPECIES: hypothetical protein [Halorubrum]KDS90869.2 hypothetical protein FK85_09085 [Halorubrum saccharovorum]